MSRPTRLERLRPHAAALYVPIILILLAGCHRERGARTSLRGEPSMDATVVTIQTVIQPENKTFVHSLVIGDDRARSGDEVDRWRLFDLKNGRVTFVDDIARTYRSEPAASLRVSHDRTMSREVPAGALPVKVERTGAKRVIQGAEASQLFLRAGSYVRELWFANHPSIPAAIYPMMITSAPPSSPLAGIMKDADAALLDEIGFPVVDHAEITYGDKKLSIDRNVIKIERRSVPQSWLNVPSSYKDVTPAPPAPKPEGKQKRGNLER